MKNRVADILGVRYPIIQGPMRLMTLSQMAVAVSNSGGFGQIAASGLASGRLRGELRKARAMTDQPFGVNIPVYRSNAPEALEVAIEMGVRAVTTSAGSPKRLIERIKEAGLRVLHKVSTVEMALKAQAAGVDGVIATGYEAGGHIGRTDVTTFCLVPQLVDALEIPVVAAGGIADARGVAAAFALGAEGVEIGTRFLATNECLVSEEHKNRVVEAKAESTTIIGKQTMPLRVLKNGADDFGDEAGQAAIDTRYLQAGAGRAGTVVPCGQAAGLIHEIKSAVAVIPEIVASLQSLSLELNVFLEE